MKMREPCHNKFKGRKKKNKKTKQKKQKTN